MQRVKQCGEGPNRKGLLAGKDPVPMQPMMRTMRAEGTGAPICRVVDGALLPAWASATLLADAAEFGMVIRLRPVCPPLALLSAAGTAFGKKASV